MSGRGGRNEFLPIFTLTGQCVKGTILLFLSFASAKESSKEKQSRFRCGNCTLLNFSSAKIADVRMLFAEHFQFSNIQGGMKCFCCALDADRGNQAQLRSLLVEILMGRNARIFQRLIFRRPRRNITNVTASEKYSACSIFKYQPRHLSTGIK